MKGGADPDIVTSLEGAPILHYSIRNKESKVVDLLLEHGADPTATDYDGYNALHVSARWGEVGITEKLLKAGLDPNAFHELDSNPLFEALGENNVEQVELLLKYCDTTVRCPHSGASALHEICYNFSPLAPHYLKRLFELGLDKEVVCDYEGTVLCKTAQRFDYQCLQICIDAGCNLNAKNKKGETTLIQLLADDNIHVKNEPIIYAEKRKKSVEMLINAGADVDIPDPQGRTPLDWAMLNKNPTGVRQLLQANCRINITKDSSIASGFMAAAVSSGDEDCATFIFGDSCSTADQQFFYDLSHTPSAMVEGESIGLSKPPLPLSRLSRLVVRASLPRKGPAFLKDVDQLPIPRRLRDVVALRLSPSDQ